MSEEELGCGINCETSGQVFEVDGLVGFEIGDVVESLVDVFVEEPEVGRPVVSKEWTCNRAVLQDDQKHEGRGAVWESLFTAFHISSSRFRIPVPRKVSLPRFTILSRKRTEIRSQQLFLSIPAEEVCVASHQQELEVFGIHSEKLHML